MTYNYLKIPRKSNNNKMVQESFSKMRYMCVSGFTTCLPTLEKNPTGKIRYYLNLNISKRRNFYVFIKIYYYVFDTPFTKIKLVILKL